MAKKNIYRLQWKDKFDEIEWHDGLEVCVGSQAEADTLAIDCYGPPCRTLKIDKNGVAIPATEIKTMVAPADMPQPTGIRQAIKHVVEMRREIMAAVDKVLDTLIEADKKIEEVKRVAAAKR